MCRFILSTTAAHLHHALQPTSTPVPLHWLKDVSLVIGAWSGLYVWWVDVCTYNSGELCFWHINTSLEKMLAHFPFLNLEIISNPCL